jgi:anti-sigma factor RsiW
MPNIANKDQRLIRYLLGELSAEERESIEGQYFQNDNFFQKVRAIEADLIDDYVNGELSDDERKKFESQYLSTPQGRRKVESSRDLLSSMSASSAVATETGGKESLAWWQSFWGRLRGQSSIWPFSFATVALFCIIGCAWLAVVNMRLRSRLEVAQRSTRQNEAERQRLEAQVAAAHERETASLADEQRLKEALQQAQAERANAEALARQKESQRQQMVANGRKTFTTFATYVFPYNPLRSPAQKGPPLVISAGQKTVQLQIDLGRTSYPGYRVSLQTVEGTETWGTIIRKARHTKAGNSITFRLPATLFTRQDYILIVTPSPANEQTESIADYSFRVVRKD